MYVSILTRGHGGCHFSTVHTTKYDITNGPNLSGIYLLYKPYLSHHPNKHHSDWL